MNKAIIYLLSLCVFSAHANNANAQSFMGDVNGDGKINLLDFVKVVNHIQGTEFLTNKSHILQADVNGDGLINSYDLEESMKYRFNRPNIPKLPLAGVLATSPYEGEAEVALTREFVVRFDMPLSENSSLDQTTFYATSGETSHITASRLSSDRMKATLFLSGYRWPSSSKITVTLNGNKLTDVLGRQIDVDGDGNPGGVASWNFSSIATVGADKNTAVEGWVLDSDSSKGEVPVVGAVISIPGNEEQMTVITDESGYFKLSPAPIGRFFVNVDGRLAGGIEEESIEEEKWKDRDYYAFVGKAWQSVAGKTTPATLYGDYDNNGTYIDDSRDGKIYLPLVKKGALIEVKPTEETPIAFAEGYIEEADEETKELLAATSLTIPAGALLSDDGSTGGSIGIAPVSPDRLPEPLPDGLELPIVITIQTDGATTFDVPIPATFPNVEGLPPGSKSALWSFDHDKGKWEIAGPMTVSEDGKFLATDPGVGIRQPGWHGSAPGAQIFGKGSFCGPSIAEIDSEASVATVESSNAAEKELLQVGRLASGLEESLFLAERNWPWRTTPDTIILLGKKYIDTPSDENLEALKTTNQGVDSLANQAVNTLGAIQLWENNASWITLSERASVIKQAAHHCLSLNKSDTNQEEVLEPYNNFIEQLTKLQQKIQEQLLDYGTFGESALGMADLLASSTPESEIFATALDEYDASYNALKGGRQRLDRLALELIRAWHDFLDLTLRRSFSTYKGESFVFLKRIGSDAEENATPPIAAQRIRVGKGGSYDAIIRPDSVYEAWMLEPGKLQLGGVIFVSPSNGGNREIAPIPLALDSNGDSDFDFLSDRGERIVGTDVSNSDTDGDFLRDGLEILNGSDPNGGNPVFTGVIASASSSSGGYSDKIIAEDDLVFLGNGVDGVDCFDVGSGTQPSLLSSVDTPGDVRKMAYSNKLLAIADGAAGITVIDFADPGSPAFLGTHPTESPAVSVALGGGIAFAGLEDGTIISMDARQGYPIDQVSFAEEDRKREVEDLVFFDGVLYAAIDMPYGWYWWWSWRSKIEALPVHNGSFHDATGRLHQGGVSTQAHGGKPYGSSRRLFVGEEYAYLSHNRGFNYLDFTLSPMDMVSPNWTQSNGWRRMVANGSGLALSAEGLTSWGQADISLYTVKSDGSFLRPGGYLENFEATFPTPGDARDHAVYNGLAYVADGWQGLQVLAYRSYETGDIPPKLEVRSNDLNGSAEEGSTFVLRAIVSDDVQVKNVDFWINGELVKVDGGYPFSLAYKVPLLTEATEFSAQIIARDTGGNEVRSETLTFSISEDATPPVVAAIYPSDDSIIRANDPVLVLFSEDLAPETVANGIIFENLTELGSSIPLTDVEYDDTLFGIRATLPDYIAPGQYRLSVKDSITDLAGNALGAAKTRYLHGPSEIHGTVWFDSDHDGKRMDIESLLEGWSVFLDLDFNGEFSEGEPITTTDASGAYSFIDLLPGSYSVNERIPHQWQQTFPGNALGDELDPTRAFKLNGLLLSRDGLTHQGNTGNSGSYLIDSDMNHYVLHASSDQNYENNRRKGIIRKYNPAGQVVASTPFSYHNQYPHSSSISLVNAGFSKIVYLDFEANYNINYNTPLFDEISFEIGSADVNATHQITLAHLLDSQLSSIDTLGINRIDENATIKSLETTAGEDGSLLLSARIDGRIEIAGVEIDENLDENSSLLVARLLPDLTIDFTTLLDVKDIFSRLEAESTIKQNSPNAYIGNRWGYTTLQSLPNGNFLISESASVTFYEQSLIPGSNSGFIDPILGILSPYNTINLGNESITHNHWLDTNGSLIETITFDRNTNDINNRANILMNAEHGLLKGWATYFDQNDSNYNTNLRAMLIGEEGEIASEISILGSQNFSYTDEEGSLVQKLSYWNQEVNKHEESIQFLDISQPTPAWKIRFEKSAGNEHMMHGFGLTYGDSSSDVWFLENDVRAGSQIKAIGPGNTARVDIPDRINAWTYNNRHYIGKVSPDGQVRLSIPVDLSEYSNLNFYAQDIIPSQQGEGAWLIGLVTENYFWYEGDYPEKSISIGASTIDLNSSTSYIAIRIGGPAAENHIIDLPLAGTVRDINFGNALPLDERKSVSRFGGSQDDQVRNLSTDHMGNLFLAGSINGRGDYEGTTLTGSAQNDAILSKYAPGGQLLWSLRFGGNADDMAQDVAADGYGGVFATGTFEGSVQFGDYELISRGGRDGFVLRLDANGEVLWATSFGGPADEQAYTLHYHNEALYVGGAFEKTAVFGTRYLSTGGNHANGFILSIAPDSGNVIDATAIVSSQKSVVNDLTIDANGRVIATGEFAGDLAARDLTSANTADQRFHATFDGNLSDLNATGTFEYVADRAGFEDRAIALTSGDALGFPAFFEPVIEPVEPKDPEVETDILTLDEGEDLPAFQNKLTEELKLDRNTSRHHFLTGFHALMDIIESDSAHSLKQFAVDLGLESSILAFTLADSPLVGTYEFTLDQDFQTGRLAEFFEHSFIPSLISVDENFAKVTETVTIESNMTGADEDLTVDLADVQVLRSIVNLFAAFASIQSGYDWDLRVGYLQQIEEEIIDVTSEELRAAHANLLGIRSTEQLAKAKTFLGSAISHYNEASPLLRAPGRYTVAFDPSAPEADEPDFLFVLEEEDFAEEAEFREDLAEFTAALSGLYEMVDEDDNETVGIIDLDKFFQGKLDLPALLPRSIGDEFESDYLTDPTIGGILPEETIDSNLTAEIREFLDLEVYQVVEETNTDANTTQPVPVPTWTVSTWLRAEEDLTLSLGDGLSLSVDYRDSDTLFNLSDGNHSISGTLPIEDGKWFPLALKQDTGRNEFSGSIAAGESHSLFLKEDGSLWAMGYNGYGQLGNGNTSNQSTPVQVVDSGVAQVATGQYHSLFLKEDGSLWAMGYNGYGQLGNGNTSNQSIPVHVVDSGVVQVAAGSNHSLFLKDDGSLWAMGNNGYGRLGNGNTSNQLTPVQVVDSGVAQVAAGEYHSLFLKDDGSLWAMGYNNYGQLGNGEQNWNANSTPSQVVDSGVVQVTTGQYHSLFLKDDGSLWAMGYNWQGQLANGNKESQFTPIQVIDSGVAQVAAGSSHSLFLKDDGSLWAMGNDGYGQLGNGNTSNQSTPVQVVDSGVVQVTAGFEHSLFLKDDGSLWAMGNDGYGRLGNGKSNWNANSTPIQVVDSGVGGNTSPNGSLPGISLYVADHFLGRLTSVLPIKPKMNLPEAAIELALDSTGGTDYEARDLSLASNRFDENASALSFNGYGTTFSFTDENDTSGRSLTTWIKMEGDSGTISLGDGISLDLNHSNEDGHTLTLGDDGNESITTSLSNSDLAVNNGWFQLGITRKSNSLGIIRTIATGDSHSLFIKKDGSLWATGNNSSGQLGNGNTSQQNTPVKVVDSGVAQVAAGIEHSLFLKEDGSLWAMGNNSSSQLGDGNTLNQSTPVQVVDTGVAQIAAGGAHSIFIKEDGSLWGMGYNDYGQLGNGNTSNQSIPVQVVDSGVAQVATGQYHTLFLKEDGSLWAMGYNGYGQLGNGNTSNQSIPVQVVDSGVAQVSAGRNHSFCLKEDDSLWAMGYNGYGQLGNGNTINQSTLVQVMESGSDNNGFVTSGTLAEEDIITLDENALVALDAINAAAELFVEKTAIESGSSNPNASQRYPTYGVAEVAGARYHSLFLKEDGSLWAMGRNGSGQFGNGEQNYDANSTPIQILDKGVVQVAASQRHSLFLKEDGSLWAMGYNGSGQLGNGEQNYNANSTPVQVSLEILTDVPQSILSYEWSINGEVVGTLRMPERESDLLVSIDGDLFAGAIDDLKVYPSALSPAQLAEIYRLESTAPQPLYDFEAIDTPSALTASSGSFELDELRLYDRAMSTTDLVKTFHLDLAPDGRGLSDFADYEEESLTGWGAQEESNQTTGFTDLFVLAWDENGSVDGFSQAGGSSDFDASIGNAIITDASGNAYLTGSFGQFIEWGDLNATGDSNYENAFAVALDQELNPAWLTSLKNAQMSAGRGLTLDHQGDLQITGYFTGSAGLGDNNISSAGGTDAFALKLDAYGEATDLQAFGGEGNEQGFAVATDTLGGVVWAGTFENSPLLPNDENATISSSGKQDAFILRHDLMAVIPRQYFEVTVATGESGSPKYFIDGEESPDLHLLRGLPYFFELDGNTTANHPFYLASGGVGGDDYSFEYLEGVENSRTTEGLLIFRLGFEGPSELTYACGDHAGMGGKLIIPSDERPRSSLTFAAVDQGGNFITDGNWSSANGDDIPVFSGQALLQDQNITLSYQPPPGYLLIGWEGDLPEDINTTIPSVSFGMDSDRSVRAVLAAYAPTPIELANRFDIEFTILPTDDFGQIIENNETKVTYSAVFNLDANSTLQEGSGSFSLPRSSNLDLNGDGKDDALMGDFSYLVGGSDSVTINLENLESHLAEDGNWDVYRGGGFSLTLSVEETEGALHFGGYSIFYEDGTNEVGQWTSDSLRDEPLTKISR